MRLLHASRTDAAWLADVLTEAGRRFGTRVEVAKNGSLVLADVG
jgi:hypothetical protein